MIPNDSIANNNFLLLQNREQNQEFEHKSLDDFHVYLYFSVYTQSSLLDFWSGMVPSPSLYSDRWTVSALPKHSLVVKTMAATVPSEPGKIALTARKKNHGPFQGWKLELENG